MARKPISAMAYKSGDEMIFGTAKYPVTTKRGIKLGGGFVHPQVVPHPRPGSEKTKKTLLREFERMNSDALDRMPIVGHPTLLIHQEQIYQMCHNTDWGADIAALTARQMDDYKAKYGLLASQQLCIADLRKPQICHMRTSDYAKEVIESFKACAPYADVLGIESMGGKEIFDHALLRQDIGGLLFAIGYLGSIDMEWMWNQIVDIAKANNCIAGGDTDCSEANTAVFMAGGLTSKDVPHVFAALTRAMAAARTLVAYECGATGPGEDCAYENPIIKAMTGIPITTEGKVSACAHSDLCSNLIAAVCDAWSNEAVEYHDMFGATTPSVFAEIVGWDCAMFNSAIKLGYQKEMKEILVNSDMYRDSHSLILTPDNAWKIGNAIVANTAKGYYPRARAAAMEAASIITGDAKMKLTVFEKEALEKAVTDMEALPDDEGNFVDMCLKKYKDVKGFNPDSYGLK